jgi:hypothetical protein
LHIHSEDPPPLGIIQRGLNHHGKTNSTTLVTPHFPEIVGKEIHISDTPRLKT